MVLRFTRYMSRVCPVAHKQVISRADWTSCHRNNSQEIYDRLRREGCVTYHIVQAIVDVHKACGA